MKERLSKLVNVKSIVTIATTAVFCFLACRGDISAEQFLTIFTTITAFYFGSQIEKRNRENGEDDSR